MLPARSVVLAAFLLPLVASAQSPAAAPTPAAPALVAPDVPAGEDAVRDAELAKIAAGYVDAFSNSGGRFTRDGKGIVFVSSRTGLPQPFVAPVGEPRAAARRLVEWPQRVVVDAMTPDGRSVLFRSDRGADENWSIYRVPVEGGAPVELTPGEVMQRDPAIVAERLPGTVFYSGRKMSEASSGLFSVPLEGGVVRTVFRDPKPFQLADVSRDGKVAAIIRFPTRSDMQLLLVDVGSGKAKQVFPAAGRKVSLNDAAFSPDGKVLFVTTDDGGEQGVILRLDAGSGEEIVRHVESGGPASLTSISVARKGETLAVGVNRGNESGLRILDAATLGIKASARLPLGQGGPNDISDDGSRVLATWSTPSVPVDLWSVNAATGEAKRLREEPRPSLASPPAMKVRVVEVKAHDGLTLPVNVYLPEGRKGKLPVIVSYHGGPAGSSQVRWSGLTAFFVSQGYAWVEPNVRGSGGFGRAFEEADNGKGRLAAFKDIEATGKWAASQRWADPDRVVVFGGSYGGYTVLVGLTRMPSLWRAGVDLFGVADLSTFMSTTSGLIREIFLLEFGDPDKDKTFLDAISPLRDADRIVDPLFVYAGANDPRVPRSESDLIVKALRGRDVPVEYMVANDEGHSLARRENMIAFAARSARFLEEYAGPVPKAQPAKTGNENAPGVPAVR